MFALTQRALPRAGLAVLATSCQAAQVPAVNDGFVPPHLVARIELPDVKGRIDHLAVDLARKRLFVAEVTQGSVDEVDLGSGHVIGRIGGLAEPQGVAWLADQRELVVACGDGTVRFFADETWREVARVNLGGDADNVRIDARNGRVIVGYGSGGLATLDPVSHRVTSKLPLPGHPEGFRLIGSRAFVNVPGRGSIVAADLDSGRTNNVWGTGLHRLNFPMTVSENGDRLWIAYRLPAAISAIDASTGKSLYTRSACGDADDLYVSKGRTIMICGSGKIEVREAASGELRSSTATSPGARTGLLVPELRRLYVAAPARQRSAALLAYSI